MGGARPDARGSWRRWLRPVLTLAVLGLGGWFLSERARELGSAVDRVGDAAPLWVVGAVGFEAASMVVFARLQRWLLQAGGVRVPLVDMVELTLAGNALAATLPGGVAWSAAWVFDQLRRRGVERFLRIWVFLVAGAVSSFALFLVVAVGVWAAGTRGPVAGLRWLVAALAAIPLLLALVLWLRRSRVGQALWSTADRSLRRTRPGAWLVTQGSQLVARVEAIRLSPLGWLEALGLGLANWVDDCAVLVLAMVALHVAVPWRGIFVIYGLTQIAAVLPLTPGGLGVVEGSLAALLTAYGVPTSQAFAVVMLYRLISFWGLVPVGWGAWLLVDLQGRRGRRHQPHPWATRQEHHPRPVDRELVDRELLDRELVDREGPAPSATSEPGSPAGAGVGACG
ncbi:lysylphosphatidylglycerol synthase transmembrane domain-containing protein [Aciditerrimonas ferrireducens]|uniref:lysylphosphatidylglycerol synthase transmembrane domain-containing protein n=1 Tax=Aciditerrimonas ferrireducens TaxID=667306 RepID=UPI002005C4B0|nr:YbhN family protein [Aciditerrimonas ferrireducens]MCK4175999.1 YbhN family protein [Aciditerrimonas ferrireducens]